MADAPSIVLPVDTTIRGPGASSATNLTNEQLRANGVGSITLPADVSLRPLPGTKGPSAAYETAHVSVSTTTGAKVYPVKDGVRPRTPEEPAPK